MKSSLSPIRTDRYYGSIRTDLLSMLPERTVSVLDVGCGSGATACKLIELGVKEVTGIDVNAGIAGRAAKYCRNVLVGDLETMKLEIPDGQFDVILMADILEHLRAPYQTVRRLIPLLKSNGSFLISIPNVTYYHVLMMLCRGRWEYAERGIMDETHLRFFTRKTFLEQIGKLGLQLVELKRNYRLLEHDMAFGAGVAKALGQIAPNELFTFQFLMRFKMAENR